MTDSSGQHQKCRGAFKQIAECNDLFMALLKGPNPLTKAEIKLLVLRRPALWGRYRKFAE
jgi:ribosomal protein S10